MYCGQSVILICINQKEILITIHFTVDFVNFPPTIQSNRKYFSFTFPSPGVSLILLAARRRQGGAGGGANNRAALKLVGNRGGSHDGDDDVTGTGTTAVFCFFFLEARFNFCAALREESRKTKKINQSN